VFNVLFVGYSLAKNNLNNTYQYNMISKNVSKTMNYLIIPGDQEGLFKLAVQLRKFFNSVIYNTTTGYVLLVYLTNI
jgi:hypothetical protein